MDNNIADITREFLAKHSEIMDHAFISKENEIRIFEKASAYSNAEKKEKFKILCEIRSSVMEICIQSNISRIHAFSILTDIEKYHVVSTVLEDPCVFLEILRMYNDQALLNHMYTSIGQAIAEGIQYFIELEGNDSEFEELDRSLNKLMNSITHIYDQIGIDKIRQSIEKYNTAKHFFRPFNRNE